MTTTSSRFKDKLKHAARISEIRKTGLAHSLVMSAEYPVESSTKAKIVEKEQEAVMAFMALLILAKIAKSKSSTFVKKSLAYVVQNTADVVQSVSRLGRHTSNAYSSPRELFPHDGIRVPLSHSTPVPKLALVREQKQAHNSSVHSHERPSRLSKAAAV